MTRISVGLGLMFVIGAACGGLGASTSDMIAIQGSVVDSVSSQPLSVTNITTGDRKTSSSANDRGEFELRLPRPDSAELVLLVRRIGYVQKTIRVTVIPDSVQQVGVIRLRP